MKCAYQHVAYLAQPDPDGDRFLDQVTFDDEHSSALDGTIVWKSLAERDKAFDNGQFTARALVHNLRDGDYGKTLSDIRAAFYAAPRLPLLYNGDRDLQQAVYEAVSADLVAIVDGAGVSVAVTAAAQVNLSSTGLRLAKPQAKEPVPPPGTGAGGTETTGGHEQPPGGGGVNDTPGSQGGPTPRHPPLQNDRSPSPSHRTCSRTSRQPTTLPTPSRRSTPHSTSETSATCRPRCRWSVTPRPSVP